jgi:predicted RNase H-like HicB family nuclease
MDPLIKERAPLFERLKKGLEELAQDARGELTLPATEIEIPDSPPIEERTYTVLYEQGSTSWRAFVPNVDGCVAVGATREEVEGLIRGALKMRLEALVRDGEPLPEATVHPGEVTVSVSKLQRETAAV